MPKMTNLEMVQDILSSMDSDNVNSVSDTVESQQVMDILQASYYEIMSRRDWQHTRTFGQLVAVSDSEQPNKIALPANTSRVICFKYRSDTVEDTREKWKEVRYVDPCEFVDKLQARDNTDSAIQEVITDGLVKLYVKNDQAPNIWTSFDNEFIYTDAYDNGVDDTLQQSRSSIVYLKEETFVLGDTAIQSLPMNMFPLLLAEAKSVAHLQLRQQPNQKAEQAASRQFNRLKEQEDVLNVGRQFADYGR